ncbi:putative transposase, partial [Shigella flexneri 2747-71]
MTLPVFITVIADHDKPQPSGCLLDRSSYRYWKNRPEKPDGRRAVLRSQVLELHGISHGSAGARSIATMATRRGYQMGRWLAGRLMKELGLVSCQQPTHRYKRGGHEHVAIP